MTFRPSRPFHLIRPSAKLHADNMGELQVASHRHAVASAVSVAQHVAPTPLSSPSLPPSELPDEPAPDGPTSDDDAPAPAPMPDLTTATRPTSHKRPLASCQSTLSVFSLSTVVSSPGSPSLDDTDTDPPNEDTRSKRAKRLAPDSSADISLNSDVQIVDINDIEDPRSERLNKTNPTADLKHFFTTLACVSNEPKQRTRCIK